MNFFNFKYIVHKSLSGYYPGFKQASSIITFEFEIAIPNIDFEIQKEKIKFSFGEFMKSLNCEYYNFKLNEKDQFFYFLELPLLLMKESGYPIFNEPIILSRNGKNQYIFLFPSIQNSFFIIKKIFHYLSKVINSIQDDNKEYLKDLKKEFIDLMKQIKYAGPLGTNTIRFIEAANAIGVPWVRLYENVYQFGWGKNKRWLDSSFSDETSHISARMARNKFNTSFLLDLAGFPVPKGFVVNNHRDLFRASEILGFPLVIKPANLDGGIGVRPSIENKEQLIKAYTYARNFSKTIMVQEHIPGKDYRIQVFKNEAYWAIERQICGVKGDGIHSINQLIRSENATRGKGKENDILNKIEIDQETIDLLFEKNLNLESIPLLGEFIQLKRIANVVSGGIPVPILEKAHKDNLNLAIEAVKIIGLDFAGVDLICEDIAISWKKSKSAICEINGQPTLAKHLPKFLLEKILQNKGRIPVIIAYGAIDNFDQFKTTISEYFPNFGLATKVKNNSAQHSVSRVSKKTLYQNAMTLILDPKIECILLDINLQDNPIELPVDSMDILFIGNFNKEINEEVQNTLDSLIEISENYVNLNKLFKPKNKTKKINLDLKSKENTRNILRQLYNKYYS